MIDKLNERITIQQSKHMTDKVGNHRNAWVDYYTCFAYASTFEAQEDEGEVTAEQKSVVFTVRWCSEVNKLTSTGFRVLFRGELYDITSVDPMNYIMAKHAHSDQVPDTPDEWLENFNTFSIYQILPQLIELWGLNVQTEVEARKNLAKVSG